MGKLIRAVLRGGDSSNGVSLPDRWLLKDFHKVLKTGCGIEIRRQQTVDAMWNLLGILTPMAMRLLWLRQTAQQAPDTPATEVVSQEVIYVVTELDRRSGVTLTANDLWRTIASFGGYLNRKSDGPPGWQTLWKGWFYIQTILQGVRLAVRCPPPSFVLTCQGSAGTRGSAISPASILSRRIIRFMYFFC